MNSSNLSSFVSESLALGKKSDQVIGDGFTCVLYCRRQFSMLEESMFCIGKLYS